MSAIERLVGVNSGGMDQSASVFSLSQHLLHMWVAISLSHFRTNSH